MKISIYKTDETAVVKPKLKKKQPPKVNYKLGKFTENGEFLVTYFNGSDIKISKKTFDVIMPNGIVMKASSIEAAIKMVETICS